MVKFQKKAGLAEEASWPPGSGGLVVESLGVTNQKQLEPREKPWLVGLYMGWHFLPSYIGIITNHYKDPS